MQTASELIEQRIAPAVFTADQIPEVVRAVQQRVRVAWLQSGSSQLRGREEFSIMISGSLEDKSDWSHGIFENSPLFRFMLSGDGSLELFQKGLGMPKLRKSKVKSLDALITKIQGYIDMAIKTRFRSAPTLKGENMKTASELIQQVVSGTDPNVLLGGMDEAKGTIKVGDLVTMEPDMWGSMEKLVPRTRGLGGTGWKVEKIDSKTSAKVNLYTLTKKGVEIAVVDFQIKGVE